MNRYIHPKKKQTHRDIFTVSQRLWLIAVKLNVVRIPENQWQHFWEHMSHMHVVGAQIFRQKMFPSITSLWCRIVPMWIGQNPEPISAAWCFNRFTLQRLTMTQLIAIFQTWNFVMAKRLHRFPLLKQSQRTSNDQIVTTEVCTPLGLISNSAVCPRTLWSTDGNGEWTARRWLTRSSGQHLDGWQLFYSIFDTFHKLSMGLF